jgi:DNA-binding winged helix-turn-helix (wHTH) protein
MHSGDAVLDPPPAAVLAPSRELTQGHRVVRIEALGQDELIYLVAHQGQVVSGEDLEQHVWRGTAPWLATKR